MYISKTYIIFIISELYVPDEAEWQQAIAQLPQDPGNTDEFNQQMRVPERNFVISLAKRFVHRGMFDRCSAIKESEILRDRFWGNRGDMCYDIRVKTAKTTDGYKLRRIVENWVRSKTPRYLKDRVHCVVKTRKYVAKQEKESGDRLGAVGTVWGPESGGESSKGGSSKAGGSKGEGGKGEGGKEEVGKGESSKSPKAKSEEKKCPKCLAFKKYGTSKGPHASFCEHYKKPTPKRPKESSPNESSGKDDPSGED